MYLSQYGPYRVGELLGQGGSGAVLRGFHSSSNRVVALKVPKAERPQEREALRREIGILSRMNRAGIRGVVRILEHGIERGTPWYAMELLDSRSLRLWKELIWAREAPLTTAALTATSTIAPMPDLGGSGARLAAAPKTEGSAPFSLRELTPDQLIRVLNVLLRVAEVLAQIHAAGVVHGDLTPSNILFRDETDPVLIDFGTGLAQLAPESFRELPVSAPLGYGTAAYVAPEVISGETRDARCDLYAFGCISYELLTGERPFVGTEAGDTLRQHLYAPPPRPSARCPGIPTALDELVSGLLAKDPLRRTAHAEDVCRILGSQLPQQPKSFRDTFGQTTLYRPKLRGRDSTLSQLGALLPALAQGQGGFILLSGPSGIGKTRLMKELSSAAWGRKLPFLWCRSQRGFAPGAAQPLPSIGFELFSGVIEQVTEALGRAGDAGSSAVARALEDVLQVEVAGARATRQRQREPENRPETSQLARSRALDGLLVLLRHVAGDAGLLLLIDDLQWADELSLSFLRQHGEAFCQLPLLCVANFRTEGPQRHPDPELLRRVSLHLTLEPLEPRETERIAKDILATDALPTGLFAFLHKHSQGNPFFVGEYTRAAVSSGLLRRSGEAAWRFEADQADGLAVPTSIDGLLGLRVQQLSEASRRALQQASVLGSDFDLACFESLVSAASDPAEALEELVAREILHATPSGQYRFAHDALREAQERTLSGEQRRHYHRVAAVQLEQRGEAHEEGAIGYHWSCAQEPRRALDYLERAAARARSGHALERAAELYRLAIKQCLLLPDGDVAVRRVHLSEALADISRQQARHAEARDRLRQILEWLPVEQGVARARIWRKLAASHWTVHEYPRASEALDLAEVELANQAQAPEYHGELIELRLGRSEQLYFSGKVGPLLDTLIAGLRPLLESHGSNDQRCRYYFMASSHVMLKRRYAFDPEALRLAESGLAAAHAVAPERVAMARFILGYAFMLGSREQCRLALPHFEEATREAERTGEATLLSRVRTYHAITSLRLGDLEATAALAELALEAANAAHLQPYLGAARACQGWVAWRKGDAQRCRALLEAGRDCWRSSAHGFPFSNLAVFPLIDLACGADDFETGRDLLCELESGLPALPEVLCAVVREAIVAIESAPPLEASRAMSQVVDLARTLAFA